MKQKSAYQYLLEKTQEMMRRTEGREYAKGPLPEGLVERLNYLEKVVHEFILLNDKMLLKLGATPDEVRLALLKVNPFLNERDAETIRFGRQVLDDARKRYSQLSILIRAIKSRGEVDMRTGNRKVLGKSRKRKFRRVGGKDNWTPL